VQTIERVRALLLDKIIECQCVGSQNGSQEDALRQQTRLEAFREILKELGDE